MTTLTGHERSLRALLRTDEQNALSRCSLFAAMCAERIGLGQLDAGEPRLELYEPSTTMLNVLWEAAQTRDGWPPQAQQFTESLLEYWSREDTSQFDRDPIDFAHAENALIALAHAGQVWFGDPIDNAVWAGRQLIETMFVAYSSSDWRLSPPHREAVREFEQIPQYRREIKAQLEYARMTMSPTEPVTSFRTLAQAGHLDFTAGLEEARAGSG